MSKVDETLNAVAETVYVSTGTPEAQAWLIKHPIETLEGDDLLDISIKAGHIAAHIKPEVIAAQEKAYAEAMGYLKQGLIKPPRSRKAADPNAPARPKNNFITLLAKQENNEESVYSLQFAALVGGRDAHMPEADFQIEADEDAKEVSVKYRKNGVWQQDKVTGTYPGSVAYNVKVAAGLLPEPKKAPKVIVAS